METDLDYIGATRRDRIIAEQVRRQHQKRLEWVARWLDRFGWTFDELPLYLAAEIPFLANRGGEALRALVAACILDHNDIATLALSIEGMKRVLVHAADPTQDPTKLPAGLPDPVVNLRTLWHPVNRCSAPHRRLVRAPLLSPLRPGGAAESRPLPAPASPRGQGLAQGRARPGGRRPLGHGESPDARSAAANRPLERSNPGPEGGPDLDHARPSAQLRAGLEPGWLHPPRAGDSRTRRPTPAFPAAS